MDKIYENIKKHMEYLCLKCGARQCGSEGERLAADYIEDEFKKSGYETVREYYDTFGWVCDEFSLYNVTQDREITNVTASYFSNSCDIEGEPLLITYEDVDRIEELPVKGRICFVEPNMEIMDTNPMLVGGLNAFEEKLDKLGAAAAIFIGTYHLTDSPSTKQPRSPHIEKLAAMTLGRDAAIDMRKNIGDTYRLRISARKFPHRSCNVIARVPGSGRKGVVGAHYDTSPFVQGAGDNASGTAVVLELARLAKGKCGDFAIDFCTYSAEEYIPRGEKAAPGSANYVKAHKDEDIRWYLNIDDVGMYLSSYVLHLTRPELLPEIKSPVAHIDNKGPFGDDAAYINAGIPTVWMGNLDPYKRLHTAEDCLDNISLETVAWAVSKNLDLFTQLING